MTPRSFTPITFRSETVTARIQKPDGNGDLAETTVDIGFHFDPLTGRSSRFVPFQPERIVRPDLDALEKLSLQFPCPFCRHNIDGVTTRFPADLVPDGMIKVGESVTFPNVSPYDVYCSVAVLSPDRHFIRLPEFDAGLIVNTFLGAQRYLQLVADYDERARWRFIGWNYLPASGGSLVHPHIQCDAGYRPTVFQKVLFEESYRWYAEFGTNYFEDLIRQEQELGQRYIGRVGETEWLTDFAPKGRLFDVLVFFPGKASILELTRQDWHDFAAGLLKLFAGMDELNVFSFNLATYSGDDTASCTSHIRITPRGDQLYSPVPTSDQFYYTVLQDENVCIMRPEEAARRLGEKF